MSRRPRADGGSDDDPPAQSRTVSADLHDDERPSMTVVRAVAALTDTSPLDLDPLYDTIDPDKLDELFRDPDGSAVRADVRFTYSGCRVIVTEDEVHVQLLRDDT